MKRNVLLILFFKFQLLNRERERGWEGEWKDGFGGGVRAWPSPLAKGGFRQLGFIKHGEFAWKLCYLQCLTHCLVSLAALWFKKANAELEVFWVFTVRPLFLLLSCFHFRKFMFWWGKNDFYEDLQWKHQNTCWILDTQIPC